MAGRPKSAKRYASDVAKARKGVDKAIEKLIAEVGNLEETLAATYSASDVVSKGTGEEVEELRNYLSSVKEERVAVATMTKRGLFGLVEAEVIRKLTQGRSELKKYDPKRKSDLEKLDPSILTQNLPTKEAEVEVPDVTKDLAAAIKYIFDKIDTARKEGYCITPSKKDLELEYQRRLVVEKELVQMHFKPISLDHLETLLISMTAGIHNKSIQQMSCDILDERTLTVWRRRWDIKSGDASNELEFARYFNFEDLRILREAQKRGVPYRTLWSMSNAMGAVVVKLIDGYRYAAKKVTQEELNTSNWVYN